MGAEAELHINVLPPGQRRLFESISSADWISSFYLAGGTALALQIGHRRSIDFDFFINRGEIDLLSIKKQLQGMGEFELFSESKDTLNAAIDSIKISFFALPCDLIGKEIRYNNLRLASIKDIAAMKLAAIASRGSRKDFVDVCFLLKWFSLKEMIASFEKKYGKNRENVYCVLKGLIYFNDAEEEPMPRMIKQISWDRVKKQILSEHRSYIKGIE